jgi:hypothetical protein
MVRVVPGPRLLSPLRILGVGSPQHLSHGVGLSYTGKRQAALDPGGVGSTTAGVRHDSHRGDAVCATKGCPVCRPFRPLRPLCRGPAPRSIGTSPSRLRSPRHTDVRREQPGHPDRLVSSDQDLFLAAGQRSIRHAGASCCDHTGASRERRTADPSSFPPARRTDGPKVPVETRKVTGPGAVVRGVHPLSYTAHGGLSPALRTIAHPRVTPVPSPSGECGTCDWARRWPAPRSRRG